MSRKTEIEYMTGTEERLDGHLKRWMEKPEIKAALHAHDGDVPRPMVGLFAQLTPEQQAAALAYDGPENLGDPDFKKRY